MALDQHLAFEGIALRGVGADVKQIGIAAEDFAIPEHDNAAALAGTTVLQADVDRIEAVFHGAPVNHIRPAEVVACYAKLEPAASTRQVDHGAPGRVQRYLPRV